MTKELKLTPEQRASIKAILDARDAKMDTLPAGKEPRMALMKESEDKITAVLTPEQQARYAAIKKGREDERKVRQEKRTQGDSKPR